MTPRRLVTAIAGLSLLAVGGSASAQLPLPEPSPRAQVMQTVGVTEITVNYASPAKRDRAVFGGLVPHGELWRTGANAATTLELSHDATIGGVAVPAGKYALFSIPGKDTWTIIVNGNPDQGGTRMYDQKLDAARFQTRPARIPKRERLTFIFSDTTDDSTRLDLEWDEVRVSIPIRVDTAGLADANIRSHLAAGWRPLTGAARYMLDTVKDHDRALALINASIAVQETWFNTWVKATILAAKGDRAAAYAHAQRAWALGEKDDYFFFRDRVAQALKDWK